VVDLRGLELRARHAVLSNRFQPTTAPFVGFEIHAGYGTGGSRRRMALALCVE
jgi:hypothetical protein